MAVGIKFDGKAWSQYTPKPQAYFSTPDRRRITPVFDGTETLQQTPPVEISDNSKMTAGRRQKREQSKFAKMILQGN